MGTSGEKGMMFQVKFNVEMYKPNDHSAAYPSINSDAAR